MKYYNAYTNMRKTPKEEFRHNFQKIMDARFYESSDWFNIEEEDGIGSRQYKPLDVRINYVVNSETGEKLSDDYKLLMFKELEHNTGIGWMYYFDDNYWLCINTEKQKSLTTTITVKRCNNMLRWTDENGEYFESPCIMNYLVKENRDYATAGSALYNPTALLEITTQFNSFTNKIIPNQRFLFGNKDNWTAYKVFGGGINNYINQTTTDNLSTGNLVLSLGANYVNIETDDIVNGIADAYHNIYSVNIINKVNNLTIGSPYQLVWETKKSDFTYPLNIIWKTSDASICSVSSTGLLTPLLSGTVIITAEVNNNPNVYDEMMVIIQSAPVTNYQILLSPNVNYVYELQTTIFNVYLYLNGVQQTDVFTFTDVSIGVPAANYKFTVINGNSFSINNKIKDLTSPVRIQCVSGLNTIIYDIMLKGVW